jgi:hypothetical protein
VDETPETQDDTSGTNGKWSDTNNWEYTATQTTDANCFPGADGSGDANGPGGDDLTINGNGFTLTGGISLTNQPSSNIGHTGNTYVATINATGGSAPGITMGASATWVNQQGTLDVTCPINASSNTLAVNDSLAAVTGTLPATNATVFSGSVTNMSDSGSTPALSNTGSGALTVSGNVTLAAGATATFDFQFTNPTADGICFVVQNSDSTAVGGVGGTLGYDGMQGQSVGVEFDLYPGISELAVGIDGAINSLTGQQQNEGGAGYCSGGGQYVDLTKSGINFHSLNASRQSDIFQAQVIYNGYGTWTITVTDTATGGTTAVNGTLQTTGTTSLGSGTVTLVGGTLSLRSSTSSSQTYLNNLSVVGPATIDVENEPAVVGPLSIGSCTLTTTGAYGLILGTTYVAADPAFAPAGPTLTLGQLAGTQFTISGPGTVVDASPDAGLAGAVTVNVTGGTFEDDNSTALGTQPANAAVSSNGALSLGANQSLASLTGTGIVELNGNELTVETETSNFQGQIVQGNSAGGSLVVAGTGVLTVPANFPGTSNQDVYTYSGPTTVNGGSPGATLLVNGAVQASPVTVDAGGTLEGAGDVYNSVMVDGGSIIPGPAGITSSGLLTTGNLSLTGGATRPPPAPRLPSAATTRRRCRYCPASSPWSPAAVLSRKPWRLPAAIPSRRPRQALLPKPAAPSRSLPRRRSSWSSSRRSPPPACRAR